MKRTLSLRRERLTALTTTELAGVAGGTVHQQTPPQQAFTDTCFETVFCTLSPYVTQGSSCDYC
jgi:hypothetical protein